MVCTYIYEHMSMCKSMYKGMYMCMWFIYSLYIFPWDTQSCVVLIKLKKKNKIKTVQKFIPESLRKETCGQNPGKVKSEAIV